MKTRYIFFYCPKITGQTSTFRKKKKTEKKDDGYAPKSVCKSVSPLYYFLQLLLLPPPLGENARVIQDILGPVT